MILTLKTIILSLLRNQFPQKAFCFALIFSALANCEITLGQLVKTQSLSDKEIYTQKIQKAQGEKLDDFTLNIAKGFLNRPYKASTLEINKEEKLVVNLKEFDCATFVESCLAMGLTYRKNDINFEKFKYFLKRLRYYNKGEIKGYESRIHYFSDWIYMHNQDGLLEDLTASMGGVEYKKNINFMSTHWEKYPFLQNTALREKIQKIEERISSQTYYFIPKSKIKSIENQFQNGDIIAITTNVEGLDVSHQGFAIRLSDNRVYFLHASSDNKRVMVSEKPLAEYMSTKKIQTGIMVARLK
jgi:Protein of unknown function (DUF1460)